MEAAKGEKKDCETAKTKQKRPKPHRGVLFGNRRLEAKKNGD